MLNNEQSDNTHISMDCYVVEHHITMTRVTGNTAYNIMPTFRTKQSHLINFTTKYVIFFTVFYIEKLLLPLALFPYSFQVIYNIKHYTYF